MLNGYRIFVGGDDNALEIGSGMFAYIVNVINATKLCTLKWLKWKFCYIDLPNFLIKNMSKVNK